MVSRISHKQFERLIEGCATINLPPLPGVAEIRQIKSISANIREPGERRCKLGLHKPVWPIITVLLQEAVIAAVPLAKDVGAVIELSRMDFR